MKPHFKPLATILALAILGGCNPAMAAVPLRWTVETSRAAPQRIDVYRGETVTIAADLTSYGQPLALAGSVALYLQTNGMANAWWTVPATVSSNRLEATLAPSAYPADATLLNCYLGGPAVNYRAAFQARILGAPGPAPNTVQPPVVTLDFSAFEVANAPYWTKDEADSRFGGSSLTAAVVTNIAEYVVSNGNAASADKLHYNDGKMDVLAYISGREGQTQYRLYLKQDDAGPRALAFKDEIQDIDLTPYALAAQVATNANNGVGVHINNEANPHHVTAEQIGAVKTNGTTVVSADWSLRKGDDAILEYSNSMMMWKFDGASKMLKYGQYLAWADIDQSSGKLTMFVSDGSDDFPLSLNEDLTTLSGSVATLSNRVEAIPYTYLPTNSLASVNCSVQTIVNPATVLQFQVPEAVSGGIRDWIVHVVNTGSSDINLAASPFPSTVDSGKTALFYSYAAAADMTKACKAGKITTFCFTEIGTVNNQVIFSVMRGEQDRISPAQ